MKVTLISLLLGTLSLSLDAQVKNSLKSALLNKMLIRALDSLEHKYDKGNNVDILGFVNFRFQNKYAIFLWRENYRLRGCKIIDKDDNMVFQEIRTSKLKRLKLSLLFSDTCNLDTILQQHSEIVISHDPLMYLRRNLRNINDKVYFSYSSYLDIKDSCVSDIKVLLRLH